MQKSKKVKKLKVEMQKCRNLETYEPKNLEKLESSKIEKV